MPLRSTPNKRNWSERICFFHKPQIVVNGFGSLGRKTWRRDLPKRIGKDNTFLDSTGIVFRHNLNCIVAHFMRKKWDSFSRSKILTILNELLSIKKLTLCPIHIRFHSYLNAVYWNLRACKELLIVTIGDEEFLICDIQWTLEQNTHIKSSKNYEVEIS